MRAAFERGDVDEAAREGALSGPAIVEQALASPDRMTRLAAVAGAPLVEDRAELLEALARAAAEPDRRTAIPAASAARSIARELANHELPDDIAPDDIATWRRMWAALALRGDRWIELRMLALQTAAALDPGGIGVNLSAALADPDPALRREAVSLVPLPAAIALRGPLAGALVHDIDAGVALAAAQSLCMSIPGGTPGADARPILDAIGPAGLARIRVLITERSLDPTAVRDAAVCVAASKR
jgi:hypothetical protein